MSYAPVETEIPLWLQAGEYPARVDRQLIDAIWPNEGVLRGLAVTAVAPWGIDVSPGVAVIKADSQPGLGGSYLVASTEVVHLTIDPASASGSRIDLIVMRVNDPDAGGDAGDNGEIVAVSGTVGSPAPTVPENSLELARIGVNPTDTSILTSTLTGGTRTSASIGYPTFPNLATLKNTWTVPVDGAVAFLKDEGSVLIGKNSTWRWLRKTFPVVTGNTSYLTYAAGSLPATSQSGLHIDGRQITLTVNGAFITTAPAGGSDIAVLTMAVPYRLPARLDALGAVGSSVAPFMGPARIVFWPTGVMNVRYQYSVKPLAYYISQTWSVTDLIPA